MRKFVVLAVVSVVLASAAAYLYFRQSSERGVESTVSRVVDGDTIEMANGDIVRLIGIDAPEKNHPYSDGATGELRKLEGNKVRLEKDVTNKDRYGRYLRYVFFGDHFVNLELVKSGLAYVYIVKPNDRYGDELSRAEEEARTRGVGIWEKSGYSACVHLRELHYNAKGDDSKNLGDEYFSISNSCDSDIFAEGWVVRNRFDSYRIPDFQIAAGKTAKIFTGNGSRSDEYVFLSTGKPILSNRDDEFYLIDGSGRIILEKAYRNE